MNLRLKVFLSVGGVLLAIFFSVYNVLTYILIADFRNLEKNAVEENVGRLSDAFDNKIDDLAIKVSDWGQWDDTYTFVQDGNQDYIDANLQDAALELLHIQFIVILDDQGKIVLKKQVDQNGHEVTFSQDFEQFIEVHPSLAQHENGQSIHAGVISLNDGVIVNVARAITSSDGTTPVKGTIMFAFFVDDNITHKLAELTHLKIEIKPYREALKDDHFSLASQNLEDAGSIFIAPASKDDTIVHGYGLKKDIDGKKALILEVESERSLYQRGQASIQFFTRIMFGASLLVTGVILLLFEYLVLHRLFRLGKAVEEISQNHNTTATILLSGKDEFSTLSKQISVMLNSLRELKSKEDESEKQFLTLMEKKNGELSQKVTELEKVNELMIDRELKMVELKKEIKKIKENKNL